MHNNYYFLRQIASALETTLHGTRVLSCFSQSKDELVIEFYEKGTPFFMVASLQPELQCLAFPPVYKRARKNSITLFEEIIGQPFRGIRSFNNERSIGIRIGESMLLVFKMHGKQSNVILTGSEGVIAVFRNNLPADLTLNPDSLDRGIDWSREGFEANHGELRSHYPTFGRPVWEYLETRGFSKLPQGDQWNLIQETRRRLGQPEGYFVEDDSPPHLTLFRTESSEEFKSPLDAATELFRLFHRKADFNEAKKECLHIVRRLIKQCENALERTNALLQNTEEAPYHRWADLLMANLHQIPRGAASVELEDFLTPGRMITIPLKKEMTPQRLAEEYYRKAKTRASGKTRAEETRRQKSLEESELRKDEQAIQVAEALSQLEPFIQKYVGTETAKKKKLELPYHEQIFHGFTIRVGKNAAANDELTLRHTHKEDLWLHAKDTPGSHVVIRHKKGKPFPKDVIEHAASLAAANSKRKTESLCPVSYTQAKYVRKRKGDAPGMVSVQREKVILVEPKAKS